MCAGRPARAWARRRSCPEGGITSNGDFLTQVAQAQGQIWGGTATQIAQTYTGASAEIHQGAVYWVVGTRSFDQTGRFTLTSQGYVTAKHEDLEFPSIAATPAPGGRADHGLHAERQRRPDRRRPRRLLPEQRFRQADQHFRRPAQVHGQHRESGQVAAGRLLEYQGYPGATCPRWGDYSWGLFVPGTGRPVYFANEYIQYPNCTGSAFSPTAIGTCGETRDGQANWGTSVGYVTP